VVCGWILCLGRFEVGWVLGGRGSRVGGSYSLGFFGGCCDGIGVGGWLWVWLLVRVVGLLRVVSLCGAGEGGAVCLGVGWVCFVRRAWVLGACWGVVARVCTSFVTNVSSSPVITYLRWDLESASACCWVCMSVGMRPWYMVVRLIRSMCKPHVYPSVCWGVIWMWVCGASRRRSGGAICSPEYH
jgi:hypothetical protein